MTTTEIRADAGNAAIIAVRKDGTTPGICRKCMDAPNLCDECDGFNVCESCIESPNGLEVGIANRLIRGENAAVCQEQ